MISPMTTRLFAMIGVCLAAATISGFAQGQPAGKAKTPPDAAAHKAWMNEATDAQEDVREAMAGKASAKVAAGASTLQTLMARTEGYWTSRHADDIVTLAAEAKALAGEVARAAKAHKLDQANEAFVKLSTTCNTCHDLHPEKR